MLMFRVLAAPSLLTLTASVAVAQVTTVGNNRSEVQETGRDNKAVVEQATQDSDRNSSTILFNGNANRATVNQLGFDNATAVTQSGAVSGDRNSASVRQLGFRNSATLRQFGNDNGSSIDQYLDPSIGRYGPRTAHVEQHGSRNSSTVTQVLWDNVATVRQGTAGAAQSDGAVSTIYQFSAGNVATVTMVGGSPDAANRSHVEQTRIDPIVTNSNATVDINGTFNLSYLYQVGARNVASHSMTGTQNTIVGKSYGNSLQSSVLQEGYRNFATITQFAGDRNSSRIEQRDTGSSFAPAGDRQVYVTQGGSDNSSSVVQSHSDNHAIVSQNGAGTVSSISQNGVGNFARANLVNGSLDALNKSDITQQWDFLNIDSRLLADVTIRGLGNESSISQRSVRHVASVEMAGGGVGMDDGSRRRGNSVSIVQDRSLANGAQTTVAGSGHTARVQVGLMQGGGIGTITSINQVGVHANIGNDAIVRQDGQYDGVFVSQSIGFVEGEGGAVANVAARGFRNHVSINQFGRQFAFVTQGFGRESSFSATSYGGGGRRNGAFFGPGIGNNSINASQNGDRNSAEVSQEGSFNGTTIWQKIGSSDNLISVNQGLQTFGPVDGFSCGFRCEMASNSTASVTQSGRYNSAGITQYSDASRALIDQNGTGSSGLRNLAGITQFNTSSAEASIFQGEGVGPSSSGDPSSGAVGDPNYFAGGPRSAEARIRQTGINVSARIEQRGRGQYAFIDQSNGGNIASILQEADATNATAIITQSGSGNRYNVLQTQPGQYINVSQTGTNNSVTNVTSRP